MTKFGKVLVFLNLFVSMALLTWATSLSVNRLDWIDRKSDSGAIVKGEITKLKEEIDRTSKAIAEANNGYGVRQKELFAEEQGRLYRKEAFDKRLADARRGKFYVQLPREKDERIDRRGMIDVDKQGLPETDFSGKPLIGVDAIQQKLNTELALSKQLTDSITALRKSFSDLSVQISDTDNMIQAQRTILTNLRDEEKFLAASKINWDEELRTLAARQKQLEKRLHPGAGSPVSVRPAN